MNCNYEQPTTWKNFTNKMLSEKSQVQKYTVLFK